ncbi:hypothetical protein FB451DRAFT_1190215 [Mycena latifolia]|nr:hypothetical protein FB451DRAFT_1190215 [Mycena latifolia]
MPCTSVPGWKPQGSCLALMCSSCCTEAKIIKRKCPFGRFLLAKAGFVRGGGGTYGTEPKIVGLKASTNNKATTVLGLFHNAVQKYGPPSRGHGDRGCRLDDKVPGPKSGFFPVGMERLWAEDHWNHHPISGKGKDQTPLDMRVIGQLKYGMYTDHFDNVHPEVLTQYNNLGEIIAISGIGFSHSCLDDLDAAIAVDQGRNVRHQPIDVPKHQAPFSTVKAEEIF